MKAPSVPELTSEQIELVCSAAEQAAREFVFSKVSPKIVERPNMGIEVGIGLKAESERSDLQHLAKDSAREAFKTSENVLRNLRP